MRELPRIGFSSCFFHADPQRPIFKGKTLLYLEQSMVEYFMDRPCLPIMVPPATAGVSLETLVGQIDGLVLQGGSDVSPESYGEEAMKPEWAGDRTRDEYEIALIQECLRQKRPVFGICRGLQILNVALGGSLYQDISTQVEGSLVHRDFEKYDANRHETEIFPGSWLSSVYPGVMRATINSIHHQSIKTLGKGLEVEARSIPDGIIEAVRLRQGGNGNGSGGDAAPWCCAVQWHPEFQGPNDRDLLDPKPLVDAFFAALTV